MPPRKKTTYSAGRMARPRSSPGAARSRQPEAPPAPPSWQRMGGQIWAAVSGPLGRQLFALLLMAFGLLTLVTIAGVNSGDLITGWARFLVFLFGWGAYPVAMLFIAVGLLWLRHLVHQPMTWRWRPFLGFELAFVSLLTLTHIFMRHYGWSLIETGRGGGVVGWALYVLLSEYLGPLITGVLMLLIMLVGIGLAFDLTPGDLKTFGQRVLEVVAAFQARQAARRAAQERLAQEPVPPSGAPVSSVAPPAPAPPPSVPLTVGAVAMASSAAAPAAPSPLEAPSDALPSALPPLTLLKAGRAGGIDQEELRRKSRIIEETLAQFGVPARVTEVRPGPIVTQFGVSPGYVSRGPDGEEQRKVRVSQIASLADDLALTLAAKALRIEAPAPGRAVVGIEVPNEEVSLVSMRAVLESEEFRKCRKPLCFAVGLDVAGTPIVADLSVMPHLLVAGTTGSGKSVFVKVLAASLAMFNTPETLRLVTIDPKMVELSHLNGLPHLLGRTETDLEAIIRALRWVAHEMDRRYKLFATAVARHLDDYNQKMQAAGEATLPRMVVLIDELADLMMAVPEETERTLTRIAQMARATGIHLVVATQRPSTDVVTGLIKANFPARISFATTSIVDSRVIIDTPGAESLMGRGDMLFLPPDASAPLRVQGCYISDEELEAIIRAWQKLAGATPAKSPWAEMVEASGPDTLRLEGQPEDADLLEQAIALARNKGDISTSGLQRRLRISYPRAARLMEEMEKMGLVGPQESAGRKRRVILGDEEEEF